MRVIQFTPLLTVFGYLGGVTCETGVCWELHIAFASALALAAPKIMGAKNSHFGDFKGIEKRVLELMHCAGHRAYLLHLYVVSLLYSLDL